MPARLHEEDDELVLKLGGDGFDDQLAKAKELVGRRYNAPDKTWRFPNDADSLMAVVHSMEPELTAELAARVKKAAAEVAGDLITRLPDDAALAIPWRERLTPKQRAGIDFMAEHPRTLLCDEMGAGKTIEAISSVYEYGIRHNYMTTDGPRVLVVCPNSVTGVWLRELSNWAGVGGIVIDGKTPEKRAEQLDNATGWVIINWEKLQKSVKLLPLLEKIKWDAVIADEAHRAKNRKAQKTKGLWKLRAPMQIAATGTPIMNDPGELWSLLRWMRPEQYTSYWKFFYDYCDFYNGYRGKKMVKGVRNPDALRFELADKMVRRTKREIHVGIPKPFDPLTRIIPMKPAQQKLYDEALKEFWLDVVQEVQKKIDGTEPGMFDDLIDPAAELEKAAESGDLETIKMLIPNAAARLVRCRQIASSPAVLGGPDESGKLDAVMETITDAEEGRPFVVFAWYKPTVEIIVQRLHKLGIDARGFTGDTPVKDRTRLANEFQDGKFQVIVATIATGGEGIDLFRASDVLLAEEDWVPAKNQQAIDRCDRMGQENPVQAQFFRSADSVETGKLAPKLATKTLITTTILGAKV